MSGATILSELKPLLLAPPAWTLAVAESLTAGQVQARVGSISGASNFFAGGLTAYSLEQKVRHLGVERRGASAVNCVSARVAEEMARGVCALFNAQVGVATTGYAEPAPDWNVPEPFAWWAIACHGKRGSLRLRHGRVECPGASRPLAQAMVADAVIAELVGFLRELRG